MHAKEHHLYITNIYNKPYNTYGNAYNKQLTEIERLDNAKMICGTFEYRRIHIARLRLHDLYYDPLLL